MTQRVINVGATANDGTGDPLRTSFQKINDNFSELYARDAAGSNLDISDNNISAVNSNGNVELIPSGAGQVVFDSDRVIITNPHTPPAVGNVGDKKGMVSWDSNNLYVAVADYDGSTTIWKSYTLGSTFDLSLTSNGSYALVSTNTNGNVNITPNGTGKTVVKNLTTPNIITSTLPDGTAPFSVLSTTQVPNLNAAIAGQVISPAQPNITSVGTLTSLTVSGSTAFGSTTITGLATTNTVVGNVAEFSQYADIANIHISGNTISTLITNGNLNIAPNGTGNIKLTTGSAVIVTGNITQTGSTTMSGDLGVTGNSAVTGNSSVTSNFAVTGNATVGGTIVVTGAASSVTSYTAPRLISNIATGTAPLTVTSTTQVANLNVASAGQVINGTSNVVAAASGNVTVGVAGTANVLKVTSTGANIAGYANITGNIISPSFTPAAGTTAVAPIVLTSGTNLTSVVAGAVEFDGTNFYASKSTTTGRGVVDTFHTIRLTANGSNITTIAPFFGAATGAALVAGAVYEFEYLLFFTKTTAEAVTFTFGFTQVPVNVDVFAVFTPTTGPTVGTAISVANIASAGNTTIVSSSLTTAVNHVVNIKALVETNATTGGTLTLQASNPTGSITPLRGSFMKYRRLPASTTGVFS